MALKLGIVMDPIESINIKKDTSFGMLLEAQARGYEIYYMEMGDLFIDQGAPKATMRPLSVENNQDKWFEFGEQTVAGLDSLDVLLMRKDPPVDQEFIYATHIFDLAEARGTLVVNKPQSLRDFNEKLFTSWFPDLIPRTIVTSSDKIIRQFHKDNQDIICKPLDGMGGASIFRVKPDGNNLGVIIETLTNHGKKLGMFQEYLPAIKEGDKRILIIDGEPVPYCLARLPSQGETRGNLAAGGSGRPQPLSESDERIARAVAPTLKEKGLIFVGLDVIGDKVTEINVTSPTCVREIEKHYDINICGLLFDAIEKKCASSK